MVELGLQRLASRRFVRFVLVGMLNTAFGYGAYAAFVTLRLVPELALAGATVLGVGFNFMTTGRLVFGSAGGRPLLRFCLAYSFVYALNAFALRLLLQAGLPPLAAQAALLPTAVLATYQIMKAFVFREQRP